MMHMRPTEFLLLVMAVVLMLGGAAVMLADMVSPGIAIPLVAVGIAFSVVVQSRRRRQHNPSFSTPGRRHSWSVCTRVWCGSHRWTTPFSQRWSSRCWPATSWPRVPKRRQGLTSECCSWRSSTRADQRNRCQRPRFWPARFGLWLQDRCVWLRLELSFGLRVGIGHHLAASYAAHAPRENCS